MLIGMNEIMRTLPLKKNLKILLITIARKLPLDMNLYILLDSTLKVVLMSLDLSTRLQLKNNPYETRTPNTSLKSTLTKYASKLSLNISQNKPLPTPLERVLQYFPDFNPREAFLGNEPR